MRRFTCFLEFVFLILIVHISNVQNQLFMSPFRPFYTFRQENKTFYKIKNDPYQVKPNLPTPNNLFGWLNPKNNVRFRLYTRLNPELAQEIIYNNLNSLYTSNFDARKLTKIVIHGYLDGAAETHISQWILDTKNNYLKLADVNVILVDYSFRAYITIYFQAIPDTVGKRVAEMLIFLNKEGMSYDSVHLIGWSWGAQISGIAGHLLKGQIARITGLDPAGPTFRFVDNELRLDKSDAKFVDILHTNGGTTLFFGGHFGLYDALGHVDIYFNGGSKQTGCPRQRTLIFETLWCNHGRAPAYWVEGIRSPLAFPMCKCDTLNNFVAGVCPCKPEDISYSGEHLPHSTRGIFQLITRSHSPFGHGPHVEISLPDMDTEENLISSTRRLSPYNVKPDPSLPPQGYAIIDFENLKRNISFRNTYTIKDMPNDDLLKLSLKIVSGYSEVSVKDNVTETLENEIISNAQNSINEIIQTANSTA